MDNIIEKQQEKVANLLKLIMQRELPKKHSRRTSQMTDSEKIKAIEDMIGQDLKLESADGKCPDGFGLKAFCKPGRYKDTCPTCWIKALEDKP